MRALSVSTNIDTNLFPKDWDVDELGVLASITAGGTPSRSVERFWNGDIPWITTSEIEGSTIEHAREFITKDGLNESATKLIPPGAILMALYGQGTTRGKVAMLKIYAATNQACAAIILNKEISSLFIFHYLVSQYISIRKLSNTGNQENLNGAIVRSISVPRPPRKEQEAIAEALSDADALIESLEQLLTKKRHIKQGAMQELLTFKKRLPGFNGAVEQKKLGQLGQWCGGMTPSMSHAEYWFDGQIPWISSGDVKTRRLITTNLAVSQLAIKEKRTTLVPANSIIVVMRSGILRKFFPVAMNMTPMAINQDIKALILEKIYSPDFLLHAITFAGERILATCLKSGTTVESIEFRWLKSFAIPVPKLEEQTAIAQILSDMDAELTALEAKLVKARHIKQGMMQQLLTGKIRLV